METLRTVFAAVALSDEARIALADQAGQLDIPGKLVPPDNWHLTVRFLGSVDQVTYERFIGGLDQADLPAAFRVRLGRVGGFPSLRRATVMWVGVEMGNESLALINEIAEEAAQGAGLVPEERPFRPHLTLSRVRPPREINSSVELRVDVEWVADQLVVYESHVGRGGTSYEPLDSIELPGQ